MVRKALKCAIVAAALAMVAAQAAAQERITRIIVAFPPGGPVDFVARTIAETLGKELGQNVIVENRPGANGAIAGDFVARAAPDGTTLWLTSVGAVAINPALYDKLPYDPERDLTAPVSLVVEQRRSAGGVARFSGAPYDTAAEFVAAARKPRREANEPWPPPAAAACRTWRWSQSTTRRKLKVLHVPYKGAAPAITDVIAGHVDGFFGDIPGLIGHIRGGKLKSDRHRRPRKRHPAVARRDEACFEEWASAASTRSNWYAIFTRAGHERPHSPTGWPPPCAAHWPTTTVFFKKTGSKRPARSPRIDAGRTRGLAEEGHGQVGPARPRQRHNQGPID